MLPFFELTNESEDIRVDIGMILKTIYLVKPEVRLRGKILEVKQMIPKEQSKNEYWIKDSLDKEAHRLFEGFGIKEVIINLYYNE
jgi:hypothetical protein